jgi:hypothetical protein
VELHGNGQSYEAIFEAVSHGRALLERNSGFIAVYHPDGVHGLLMTLYTRDGNQPRLRAKGFGENPSSIRFTLQDITNWEQGSEHINGLELFQRSRSSNRKVGDVESGRSENTFRIRTDAVRAERALT